MTIAACPTDEALTAFAGGRVDAVTLERLAAHLTACPKCQLRLERVETQPDPLVKMLRRPARRELDARPEAGGREEHAALRLNPRLSGQPAPEERDLRLLYHRRIRLGSLIVAVVMTLLVAVRLLHADFLTTQDSIGLLGLAVFAIAPAYAAALAGYLWFQPAVALPRLRLLTNTFFALFGFAFAYRQFVYLAIPLPEGFEGPRHASTHLTGANILCVFAWFAMMVNYGVLVPETWQRVLRVVAVMAAISLASIAAAGIVNQELRPHLPFLLTWSFLVLFLGAATGTFASFQIATLRREASEAKRLGQYHLKKRLGEGGMGEVYLAEHRLLKRPCAVKLIRAENAGDPQLLRRFEREVRATCQLTHPNTVEIYDYGHADDGTFYYVMEYLSGLNLDALVGRFGPLPPERAIHLLRQLCGALHEAHAAGLVHRDLKPGNVIVCRQGGRHDVAKLLDFGLVRSPKGSEQDITRLTQQGVVLGTPAYMAPEQARGANAAEARSDLYSLGALGYFLLCGKPPFPRESIVETLAAHLHDPVEPLTTLRPEVPLDLQAVILRCLAKAPQDRFADATSLEAALANCHCAGLWTEDRARAWWEENRL
jgi:serine/threonine-protein kinase